MRSWKRKTLGDLVDTQKGYAFQSGWYSNQGRPIVKVSDFTQDSIDSSNLVRIPEQIAATCTKYELRTGDVLLQTVGSWPSNPASVVGKCVRVPSGAAGALLNQNAVRLSPRGDLDPGFLFYLLRTDDFKNYIVGTAQGAANQAAITLEAIRAYEFGMPPLARQRWIADVLSAYDQSIENNEVRIRVLESMARSIYKEWFVNPGLKSGSQKRGPKLGTFGVLCDLIKRPYVEAIHSGLPLADLKRFRSRVIALLDTGDPKELATSRIVFDPGDTLFGAIRCYLHKVAIAHSSGVTNTSVLVLRPRAACFRSLVSMIASDTETIRWAETHSTGTKMPVISWNVLQTMPAPNPPSTNAEQFERLVGPMIDQIGTHAKQIQNLRCTRDLLVSRLLSRDLSSAP